MHEKVEQPVNSYTEFEKLAWVSTKAIPSIGTKLNVKINGKNFRKKNYRT